MTPVWKNNGDFNKLEPLQRYLVDQFHLKGVPMRLYRVKINALQNPASITAKSTRAVAHGYSEHEAGEEVSTATDEAAEPRPVGCVPTRNIA